MPRGVKRKRQASNQPEQQTGVRDTTPATTEANASRADDHSNTRGRNGTRGVRNGSGSTGTDENGTSSNNGGQNGESSGGQRNESSGGQNNESSGGQSNESSGGQSNESSGGKSNEREAIFSPNPMRSRDLLSIFTDKSTLNYVPLKLLSALLPVTRPNTSAGLPRI